MSNRYDNDRIDLAATSSPLRNHSMDSSEMKRIHEGKRRYSAPKKVRRSLRHHIAKMPDTELSELHAEFTQGFNPFPWLSTIDHSILVSELRYLIRRRQTTRQ